MTCGERGTGITNLKRGKSKMTIKEKLKKILIEDLNLEDVTPEDIDDDAPLFGEGLGLDSLDAVDIGCASGKTL